MFRFIVLVVLLGSSFRLCAQTLTSTTVIRSKYVFNNGVLVHDEPVIQTDVFINLKKGFWLDIWGSVPADVKETGKDYGTEFYPTFGWTEKVNKYKVTIALGFDDLYRSAAFEKTDFAVVIGEVSRDFKVSKSLTLSPFVHVETNFTFDGKVNGDTLPRLGSYYSWEINKKVSLGGKAQILYDHGVLGNQRAPVGNVELSANWNLHKCVRLELPFVRFVGPITQVSDGRERHGILGAGITVKW